MRSIAIWRPPFGQGLPVPPQALPLPRNSPALEWQRKPKPPRPRIALLKLLLLKLLLLNVMQLLRRRWRLERWRQRWEWRSGGARAV